MNNRNSKNLNCLEKGLTLIEIMLVLIIIGLVMGTIGKRIFGAGDKAKSKLSNTAMYDIQFSLEEFKTQYNSYPTNIDELIKCGSTSGSNCIPVISKSNPEDQEKAISDAWGTKFQYSSDGRTYKITSLGADKTAGGSGADSDLVVEGP